MNYYNHIHIMDFREDVEKYDVLQITSRSQFMLLTIVGRYQEKSSHISIIENVSEGLTIDWYNAFINFKMRILKIDNTN